MTALFGASTLSSASKNHFSFGLCSSLLLHALGAYLTFFVATPAPSTGSPIVYSVSIEGGKSLGGISQVNRSKSPAQLAPPKNVSSSEPAVPVLTTASSLPKPRDVENAEISLATPKPTASAAPKATPHASKLAPKASAKPTAKASPKPPKKPTMAEVNEEYQKAMQRYVGESSDAGGKGFGAAALGGRGMGGGTVRPPEFFTYLNLLKSRIKQGWRWYDPSTALTTQLVFQISVDGRILDVRIDRSSGNSEFDASVVRAINKASPLPPPPTSVYEYFKSIRMIFDPRE
jgi:TonB family protein